MNITVIFLLMLKIKNILREYHVERIRIPWSPNTLSTKSVQLKSTPYGERDLVALPPHLIHSVTIQISHHHDQLIVIYIFCFSNYHLISLSISLSIFLCVRLIHLFILFSFLLFKSIYKKHGCENEKDIMYI